MHSCSFVSVIQAIAKTTYLSSAKYKLISQLEYQGREWHYPAFQAALQ